MTEDFDTDIFSRHFLEVLSRHYAVFIVDQSQTIRYVNDRFEQLTGYKKTELAGRGVDSILSGDFADQYYHTVQNKLQQNELWQGQAKLIDKRQRPLVLNIEIISAAEKSRKAVIFICRTIEKPEHTGQSAYFEKSHQLSKIIETVDGPVWISDYDGNWLLANSAAKTFFGLRNSPNRINVGELCSGSRTLSEVMQTIRSGEMQAWVKAKLMCTEEGYRAINGDEVHFQVRRMPVFNNDGSHDFLITICTDLHERKVIEADLLRTRYTLEQALRLARVGVWEVDFEKGDVSLSDVGREIVAANPGYNPGLSDAIMLYVEGESRKAIVDAVDVAMISGRGFELNSEIQTLQGVRKWIHTAGEPTMINGRCVYMRGYFYDITETIGLRKYQRQYEKRFEHMIEKSADMFLLIDRTGTITYCSPSVCQMLDYVPGEVVGKNYADFIYREDLDLARARMDDLAGNPNMSFPLFVSQLKKKSGVPVLVEGSITNLLHDENLNAIVASIRNVTDLVKTQRLLRQKTQRLEKIAAIFSHQVRGPVATILGLTAIFNHHSADDPVNEEVISKIVIPVSQLDDIISEIVRMTHELEIEGRQDFNTAQQSEGM